MTRRKESNLLDGADHSPRMGAGRYGRAGESSSSSPYASTSASGRYRGQPAEGGCRCPLTCLGAFWVLLSLASVALSCIGYYFPYWIEGRMVDPLGVLPTNPTFLGVFRRCHYPRIRQDGVTELVLECGRYVGFRDIPSVWWQIGMVTGGVGCGLLLFVALLGLVSCCLRHFLSHTVAKVAGILQFVAGMCLTACCVLYPMGWDSLDVRQVCGPAADMYKPGDCTLCWAYYTAMAGGATAFLCSLISCHAASRSEKSRYQRVTILS